MVTQRLSVVIVDDHEVVVDGVRGWCEAADPPIDLIDAEGLVANVWTGPGADADAVIFDLGLTENGNEFGELRRLIESGRRVVVYTQDVSNLTLLRCIEMGARAFVTKTEGKEHLIAAVRKAAVGESYTAPTLGGAMVSDSRPNRPRLPAREKDALLAWFASKSKELAAEKLGISVKTVESYIARARARYDAVGRPARSKDQLILRAIQDGITTMRELDEMRQDEL
jgi:DNA-binding NarL/FixJ family response regulator